MKICLTEEQYNKLVNEINVKYTEDQLRNIASKYNFMGDFKKNDVNAYESIRKNYRNLWDELQDRTDKKYNPSSVLPSVVGIPIPFFWNVIYL